MLILDTNHLSEIDRGTAAGRMEQVETRMARRIAGTGLAPLLLAAAALWTSAIADSAHTCFKARDFLTALQPLEKPYSADELVVLPLSEIHAIKNGNLKRFILPGLFDVKRRRDSNAIILGIKAEGHGWIELFDWRSVAFDHGDVLGHCPGDENAMCMLQTWSFESDRTGLQFALLNRVEGGGAKTRGVYVSVGDAFLCSSPDQFAPDDIVGSALDKLLGRPEKP